MCAQSEKEMFPVKDLHSIYECCRLTHLLEIKNVFKGITEQFLHLFSTYQLRSYDSIV